MFPNATKQEFKKSVLELTILLYETQFAPKLVEMLNQIIKNSALFKQIQKQCSESDQSRGGSPRL